MPDISMCMGEACELKQSCYRYKAKPSFRQSYIDPEKKGKQCKYYWKIEQR